MGRPSRPGEDSGGYHSHWAASLKQNYIDGAEEEGVGMA